jgi:hypothetical protein
MTVSGKLAAATMGILAINYVIFLRRRKRRRCLVLPYGWHAHLTSSSPDARLAMSISTVTHHDSLFPGFRLIDIGTPRGPLRARVGGDGPPLLLLHGYPQTHVMWHRVAAMMKDRFHIICVDLPGYGDSFTPQSARWPPISLRQCKSWGMGRGMLARMTGARGWRIAWRLITRIALSGL